MAALSFAVGLSMKCHRSEERQDRRETVEEYQNGQDFHHMVGCDRAFDALYLRLHGSDP
jgi:hypothetical protein